MNIILLLSIALMPLLPPCEVEDGSSGVTPCAWDGTVVNYRPGDWVNVEYGIISWEEGK